MKSNKPRRKLWAGLAIILVLVLAVAALVFDSNTRIVVSEYQLFYNDLPDSFDGFRIIVLADIHATEFGNGNARLIERVRDVNPDIIAINGDLMCAYLRVPLDVQLEVADRLAVALTEIAPVYFVTGNHEWDRRVGGPAELFRILEYRGVTVLRNRHVLIERGGDSIVLAGVDDPNGPADMIRPNEVVERIFSREGDDSFIVMLEHRNNNLSLYSSLGVQLVLSAHAHGGIVRLPFTDGLVGPQRELFPTYTSGIYTMGDTNMIVSRGLGNHIVWRFLNNPQIVVAVLRTA